eukprot:5379204-Alexandrium_andersonii.AAC.1
MALIGGFSSHLPITAFHAHSRHFHGQFTAFRFKCKPVYPIALAIALARATCAPKRLLPACSRKDSQLHSTSFRVPAGGL